MEYLKLNHSAKKTEKLDSLSISIEEEAQDLELSGFTTTGSFSSVASWIGTVHHQAVLFLKCWRLTSSSLVRRLTQ